MTVRLSTTGPQAAEDLVRQLATLREVIRQGPRLILRKVDRRITRHIEDRFRSGWEPLRPMTHWLRRVAIHRAIARRRFPGRRRLYYSKHAPRGGTTGFGWTGRVKAVATRAGRIEGRSNASELVRAFRSKGPQKRKQLQWWHFGTKTRVTPKMRAFLHTVGVHLKPSTTHLERPARPIYDDRRIDEIVDEEARNFAQVLEQSGVPIFGTTIVRRG